MDSLYSHSEKEEFKRNKIMKLYIKNMVCNRCKTTVKLELDKLGISFISVELGEITIKKKLTPVQHHLLFLALEPLGFELINNEKELSN